MPFKLIATGFGLNESSFLPVIITVQLWMFMTAVANAWLSFHPFVPSCGELDYVVSK